MADITLLAFSMAPGPPATSAHPLMTRLGLLTAPRDSYSLSKFYLNQTISSRSCRSLSCNEQKTAIRNTVGTNGHRSARGRKFSLRSIFPSHSRVVSITPRAVVGNTMAGCGNLLSHPKLERD